MIQINEGNMRRPRQAVVNRHMSLGKPLFERTTRKVVVGEENGVSVYDNICGLMNRFEVWVTKELYDSVPLSTDETLCEGIVFMLRKEKGWKTGSLYSGARAILKEEVVYDGDEETYYCMVMEYDRMLSSNIEYDGFMAKLDAGRLIVDILRDEMNDLDDA